MPTLCVLNGPNLNLLGQREPDVYGTSTLEDCIQLVKAEAEPQGWEVVTVQSNSEGALIDAIHDARNTAQAIIINPGAFTHYAYAIADALATFSGPIVELHLSNVHAREEWRQVSVVSPVVTGIIAGFGAQGYALAAQAAIRAVSST